MSVQTNSFHYKVKNSKILSTPSATISSFNNQEKSSFFGFLKGMFCCGSERVQRQSPIKPMGLIHIQPKIDSDSSNSFVDTAKNADFSITTTKISSENSFPKQRKVKNGKLLMKLKAKNYEQKIFSRTIKSKTKTSILANDLKEIPIDSLFIMKCNSENNNVILAHIKIIEFALEEKQPNIAKKSTNTSLDTKLLTHPVNPWLNSNRKDKDKYLYLKKSPKRKASLPECDDSPLKKNERINSMIKTDKTPLILFEFHEKGMLLDYCQWTLVTPEPCAKHTAKRTKNFNVILDPFCGVGGNLVHFANESQIVIGLDNKEKMLAFARQNCQTHGIIDNVHLIKGDFLEMQWNKMKPDLIFLSPNFIQKPNFSIFKDVQPDIIQVLKKVLKISKNVILSLPKFTNFKEIPILLDSLSNLEDFKDNSVEIEYLLINGKLQQIQLYFGLAKQISKLEESQFLLNAFNFTSNTILPAIFLNHLQINYKFNDLLKILYETQKICSNNDNLFHVFAELLCKYNITTTYEIEHFFRTQGCLARSPEKHCGKGTIEQSYYSGEFFSKSEKEKIFSLYSEADDSLF